MSLSARRNDEQSLVARVAALEAMIRQIPSRFGLQKPQGTYRHVTQASHGFAVGNAIRHDGTSWVKAQADSPANAFFGGLVAAVPHPNAFVVAFPGSYVRGLTVTAGINYLSAATSGALTTTAPTIAIPVLMAVSTNRGLVLSGASGGGGVTAPTEDGTVFCSKSDLSGGEWTRVVDIGQNATGKAGVLTLISPNASGDAVVIDAALVTASGRKLTIREEDVCDGGVAKKRLVLASAPY